MTHDSQNAQVRQRITPGAGTPRRRWPAGLPVPVPQRADRAVKQPTQITHEVIDQEPAEVPLPGDESAAPNPETSAHDATATVAAELARDNQRLGPLLPGYHWHSGVAARGWEQPTLDGRNGGEDPSAWLHEAARAEGRKPPSPATARSTSRPI